MDTNFNNEFGSDFHERQGGSILTSRGEFTRLKIKTVTGAKLSPADKIKAERLAKDMHLEGSLLNDDYGWCIENGIRWR